MTEAGSAAAAVTARPPRLVSAAHWHVAPVMHPRQVQVPLPFQFRFLRLGRCSSKDPGQASRARGTHMEARHKHTRITILCVSSSSSSHNDNNKDKCVGNNRRSRSPRRNYHRPTSSAIQRRLCPRTTGILLASKHSTFPLRRRRENHHGLAVTVERGGRARGITSPPRSVYRLRPGFCPKFQKRLCMMTRVWRISIRGLSRIVVVDLVS